MDMRPYETLLKLFVFSFVTPWLDFACDTTTLLYFHRKKNVSFYYR